MKENYDVIILGAGPAGLGAAYQLGKAGAKTLVIDKGRDITRRYCPNDLAGGKCASCSPCNIYAGLGGAGGKSDGKLNFHPLIGGSLLDLLSGDPLDRDKKAWDLIREVDRFYMEFGAPERYVSRANDAAGLVKKAAQNGMEFLPIDQKHIGSDQLVKVISACRAHLESQGVTFHLMEEVTDLLVTDSRVHGLVTDRETYRADRVIFAPGRAGQEFFHKISQKYGIRLIHMPIDIGFRVETRRIVMDTLTDIQYDPKIRIRTPNGRHVRTFCTNPGGFVVREEMDDYCLVNGHAKKSEQSPNTNFALLVTIDLTEPAEDTTYYAESLAHVTVPLGGKKPILQRLGDFKKRRRSNNIRMAQSFLSPTLTDVVLGNLCMAATMDIGESIEYALKKLDCLADGIYDDNNTLLYGWEIKFKARRATFVPDTLESRVISGLHFAGDGCGLTGDIVNATASGILAARGIMSTRG